MVYGSLQSGSVDVTVCLKGESTQSHNFLFANMENQRKALAFFALLFLFFVYKTLIYDPYFLGNPQQGSQPPSSQQVGQQGDQQAAQGPSAQTTSAVTEGSSTNTAASPQSSIPAPSAEARLQTSPSGLPKDVPARGVSGAPALDRYPTDGEIQAKGVVQIETDKFIARISRLGGRVTDFQLKEHKHDLEKGALPLNLVDHVDGAPFPMGVYSGAASDTWGIYDIQSQTPLTTSADGIPTLRITGQERAVLTLRGALSDGRMSTKVFTLLGDSYLFDASVVLSAPAPDASRLEISWTKLIPADAPSLLDPYKISGFVWFDGQKAQKEAFSAMQADQHELGQVKWVTVADKYFMATLINPEESTRARAIKLGQLFASRLSGNEMRGDFKIFVGPKSYQLLDRVGMDLRRNIDFGWTGFIAAPLLMLLHLLFSLVGNYGVAIVGLTILVRVLLFPLNQTAFKQMKAMQEISPEVKRIRDTVTDREQQQRELMALYKKRGVNPFGGCFPILIQMPIFIGLYSALLLAIELRHAPFAFWINDLSTTEHLHVLGFGLPVMVLLMVASMLIQQWITPTMGDPAQKKAMMIMPIVFGFMFAKMPAGLTLYWLTSNILGIAQQRAMTSGQGKNAAKITALAALGIFVLAWVLAALGHH